MVVVIRFAEESDAPGIQAIYAPFCEATAVSFETAAPTVEEMARRIRKVSEQLPWLVCEIDGQLAGYAYASLHRERAAYQWSVDVTVYVDSRHRRSGVGRRLYASLFDVLTLQGYFKAHAGIALPNPASVGLHQAMGFELVGVYCSVGFKLGSWHDVSWWQKTLRPPQPCPPPPVAIREVLHTSALEEALAKGAS